LRGVAPGTPYNCPTAEELGLDRILPSLATGDPAAYVAASDSVRKAAALVPDEDDKHVERSKGLRARILLETLADWLPNMVPTWSREPDTIDDDDLSGFTI
jgi:hypothetical protein